jgi:hypothetical protein
MKKKKSAYLETTTFNYFFDEARDGHIVTVAFFEAVRRGEIEAYTSQYVIGELQAAAEPKRSNMLCHGTLSILTRNGPEKWSIISIQKKAMRLLPSVNPGR